MKIVFLGIDGVLNSERTRSKGLHGYDVNKDYIFYDNPHPELVKNLTHIVEETGAKIVLSSMWRYTFSPIAMWRFLSTFGFHGEIIDSTPMLGKPRGKEIESWLKDKFIESFIILDDDKDVEPFMDHLISVDPMVGLTVSDAEKAIALLNEGQV